MSLAKILNSCIILSTAVQGSSAAVLPGRRYVLPANQVDTIDHAKHERASTPNEILDDVFGHGDVVKRAPQDVEVSESDVLQLIDDVRAVELQMQDWLNGVSVPGDAPPSAGATDPAAGAEEPRVSNPSPDELITATAGPVDVDGAAPTAGSEAAPESSGCMLTVTETFTEYISNGPSALEDAFRLNATSSLDIAALEASATASLPFGEVSDSVIIPLESSALEDLPEDDNLVPFAISEDFESLPTSSIADLWDAAAPSITPPPAVTDDPILEEGGEGSEDEIDLLGQNDTDIEASSGDVPQETSAPEAAPEVPEESPVQVAPPTEMTLQFPADGSSGIVWRTISIPSM